jgi:diaminopimelate epimerase
MTPAARLQALRALAGTRLTKGHGTENDFVLVDDPDGRVTLTAETVAALADRRGGIGGDGVIRAVRTANAADPDAARVLAEEPGAEWFMDYRNADGSLAEMCGNGVRVFVDHLLDRGHVALEEGGSILVATRGGARRVRTVGGDYAVEMGRFGLPGGERAVADGADVAVVVPGLDGTRAGLRVTMPNPHTVVALPSVEELEAAELRLGTVDYAPVPEDGTNLELVGAGGGRPGRRAARHDHHARARARRGGDPLVRDRLLRGRGGGARVGGSGRAGRLARARARWRGPGGRRGGRRSHAHRPGGAPRGRHAALTSPGADVTGADITLC